MSLYQWSNLSTFWFPNRHTRHERQRQRKILYEYTPKWFIKYKKYGCMTSVANLMTLSFSSPSQTQHSNMDFRKRNDKRTKTRNISQHAEMRPSSWIIQNLVDKMDLNLWKKNSKRIWCNVLNYDWHRWAKQWMWWKEEEEKRTKVRKQIK